MPDVRLSCVARLEVVPFSDEHLEAGGELLAARHARHRRAEPLLDARFEEPAAAREELEAAWGADGASGAAALRDGRLVGFLVGAPRRTGTWGDNVWIEPAGHAVEEAEDVRDLYAAAAAGWVEGERRRHYVVVPASDAELVDAWFRVGFGQQQAHGIQEVPAHVDVHVPDGFEIRSAAGGGDREAARGRQRTVRASTDVAGLLARAAAVARRRAPGVAGDAGRRRGDGADRLARRPRRGVLVHERRPAFVRAPQPRATGARVLPRLRRDPSGDARLGNRRRAHRRVAGRGCRGRLSHDGHGLAGHESPRLPLLAEARLPARPSSGSIARYEPGAAGDLRRRRDAVCPVRCPGRARPRHARPRSLHSLRAGRLLPGALDRPRPDRAVRDVRRNDRFLGRRPVRPLRLVRRGLPADDARRGSAGLPHVSQRRTVCDHEGLGARDGALARRSDGTDPRLTAGPAWMQMPSFSSS